MKDKHERQPVNINFGQWRSLDQALQATRGGERRLSLPVRNLRIKRVGSQAERDKLSGLQQRALKLTGAREGDIILTGYAIKWNDVYQFWPGYTESFEKGAFAGAMGDVRFLEEHEGPALAREDAGTSAQEEDTKGLAVMAAMDPRDSKASDLAVRIERMAIQGLSVGFTMRGGTETVDYFDEGGAHYTIVKVGKLWEYSAVTFPAYEDTEVAIVAGDDMDDKDGSPSFTVQLTDDGYEVDGLPETHEYDAGDDGTLTVRLRQAGPAEPGPVNGRPVKVKLISGGEEMMPETYQLDIRAGEMVITLRSPDPDPEPEEVAPEPAMDYDGGTRLRRFRLSRLRGLT